MDPRPSPPTRAASACVALLLWAFAMQWLPIPATAGHAGDLPPMPLPAACPGSETARDALDEAPPTDADNLAQCVPGT